MVDTQAHQALNTLSLYVGTLAFLFRILNSNVQGFADPDLISLLRMLPGAVFRDSSVCHGDKGEPHILKP